MKYNVSINQFAIIEAGFDFDLVDAAIFEVLKDYTHSAACKKMQDDEKAFFNVPYKVIIEELPLAKINKPDSVYRRFQKLEQYGVIEMHPDNKRLKQVWFSWGRNYDRMLFRTKTGFKSDQPDFDPAQTGFQSVLRPDLNPPHHTTISFNHPTIESARALETEKFDLEASATAAPFPPVPAAPLSPGWNDRPNTDTPERMREDLQRFYEKFPSDWQSLLSNAGATYTTTQRREIVTAFCAYQIENNRTANTYRQTHAALQRWFIGQKMRNGQSVAPKSTITRAGSDPEHYRKPQAF